MLLRLLEPNIEVTSLTRDECGNQGGFFQKYICERNKEKMESFFITEYDKCMSKKCFTFAIKPLKKEAPIGIEF